MTRQLWEEWHTHTHTDEDDNIKSNIIYGALKHRDSFGKEKFKK